MKNQLLYGASDDLIILEGKIDEEIDALSSASSGVSFECSDGTKGTIQHDGDWKIKATHVGTAFVSVLPVAKDFADEVVRSVKSSNAPEYSDILVLSPVNWIKIGRKTFKNK